MKPRLSWGWLLLFITAFSLLMVTPGAGERKKEEPAIPPDRQAAEIELEVELLPKNEKGRAVFSQGEVFLVRIRDPRNLLQKASASWDGRTIPCLPHHQQPGWLHGLGAIDRRREPGTYTLSIRLVSRGGEFEKLEKEFRVQKTRYPSGRLSVAGDKVELSQAALNRVREERKAFKNAWDSSSYVRLWSGPFLRPTGGRITSAFGEKRVYNNGKLKNVHRGVDLSAAVGESIKATATGKVMLARFCFLEGGLVIMDHGGGLFTLYCHLSQIKVDPGEIVDKGSVIGLAGNTGRVTGPHLHWGCGVQGVRVDPTSLLKLNRWLKE